MKNITRIGRTALAVLLLAAISSGVSAQSRLVDVVYLNNGTIIRGTLQESAQESKVIIETESKNLWVFEKSEVLKMTQEKPPQRYTPGAGYYNLSEIGVLGGKADQFNRYFPSITTISGYQFGKRWAAGGGVGYEYQEIAIAPLFADVRYNLLESTFSPFAAVQGGYAIPFNGNRRWRSMPDEGGVYLAAKVGIRNFVMKSTAIALSIGVRHQRLTTYSWGSWEGDFRAVHHRYNSIEVRLGLLFN